MLLRVLVYSACDEDESFWLSLGRFIFDLASCRDKKQNKEQQDQPEPSPQPDPKESPEQGAPEETKGQSPSHGEGMSDENMQRWLDAVENETAENIKDFLKKQQPVNVIAFPEDW